MASNGSFYQNGLPISTAETGVGNVNPGAPVPKPANSSFYLSGTVYQTLANQDALMALLTSDTALVVADLVSANAASASASASAASAASSLATLNTTALLKANNLSDLQSVATAKVNLSLVKADVGLGNVDNTSDANKPLSTADTTALALKAPLAGPALTGVPTAPTAAANNNTTQLATTAYVDAADALKAPLASPTFTGAITASFKGNILGTAAGTLAPAAPATTDANILFYNGGAGNWSGVGTDANGAMWFRTGLSGTPAPAFYIDTAQSTHFVGTPVAPTAAVNTNTTQLATTAFVLAQAAAATPLAITGAGAVGTATKFAREDHVHPMVDASLLAGTALATGVVTASFTNITAGFTVGPTGTPPSGTHSAINLFGANTGTAAGSNVAGTNGGTTTWAVGNTSSMLGGAYDATLNFYQAAGLYRFSGLATAGAMTTDASGNVSITPKRETLTGARTYYVLTTGSDSNTGLVNTAGGAFLTLQKAINAVIGLDIQTFNVTIQVGAGTYTGGVILTTGWLGTGTVTITGDTTTPSNVVISTTSADCFKLSGGATSLNVQGFKLVATTAGYFFNLSSSATVNLTGKCEFGAYAYGGFSIGSNAILNNTAAAHTISGGNAGGYFLNCFFGGTFSNNAVSVWTLTANISVFAFAASTYGGKMECGSMTFPGAFTVTGTRFIVNNSSFLDTGGGGANYFPGTVAGTGTNFSVSPWGLYL